MTSLHIEHRITDLETWTSVFSSFDEIRRRAGVIAETVRHLHGDDRYVVIDLQFDTVDHAHAFLHLLRTEIWAVPANSPALEGAPEAKLLEDIHVT